MPLLDGIEATRRITALPGPPKVVVLTTFDVDEHALDAIRAGASGFLLKGRFAGGHAGRAADRAGG